MTTIKRQRKIIVPKQNIALLADEFGLSKVSIYNALRFVTNSELAALVRKAAVDRYNGCPVYYRIFED